MLSGSSVYIRGLSLAGSNYTSKALIFGSYQSSGSKAVGYSGDDRKRQCLIKAMDKSC